MHDKIATSPTPMRKLTRVDYTTLVGRRRLIFMIDAEYESLPPPVSRHLSLEAEIAPLTRRDHLHTALNGMLPALAQHLPDLQSCSARTIVPDKGPSARHTTAYEGAVNLSIF